MGFNTGEDLSEFPQAFSLCLSRRQIHTKTHSEQKQLGQEKEGIIQTG